MPTKVHKVESPYIFCPICTFNILFFRYSQTEIETKVAAYRNMLVDNDGNKPTALPRDEFGRVV
jgi:hypothetical protein